MKLIMRGNKQLRIPEERLEDMLAAGYCEIDENSGRVLRSAAVRSDVGASLEALKKENEALRKKTRAQAARIAKPEAGKQQ